MSPKTLIVNAIFFTVVRVGCALLIVWSAWTWREPAAGGGAAVAVDAEG